MKDHKLIMLQIHKKLFNQLRLIKQINEEELLKKIENSIKKLNENYKKIIEFIDSLKSVINKV